MATGYAPSGDTIYDDREPRAWRLAVERHHHDDTTNITEILAQHDWRSHIADWKHHTRIHVTLSAHHMHFYFSDIYTSTMD